MHLHPLNPPLHLQIAWYGSAYNLITGLKSNKVGILFRIIMTPGQIYWIVIIYIFVHQSPPHRMPVAGVPVFHAPPPPAPATSTPEYHYTPDPQSILADTLKERRKRMQSGAR